MTHLGAELFPVRDEASMLDNDDRIVNEAKQEYDATILE